MWPKHGEQVRSKWGAAEFEQIALIRTCVLYFHLPSPVLHVIVSFEYLTVAVGTTFTGTGFEQDGKYLVSKWRRQRGSRESRK